MITMARALADEKTAAPATAFITDVEALADLNASVGIWHGMLVDAVPERFEAEATITATGAASYALPSTYYQTLGVDALWGSQRMPLKRIQFQDRTRYELTGEAEGYYIKAATIVLAPAPSSGTFYHQYVTAAPVLVAATTVDGVNGWEMWPVYDLAIKMLAKSETSADALLQKQAELKTLMMAAAADRETANPMRVVDTRLGRY